MAETAGGIRAGAAYVEMALKDSAMRKGLDAAAARVKAFGAGITALGGQFIGVASAAAAPFLAAAAHFADAGGAIQDVADRTGMTAEAVSELAYAAEQSGANLATLEGGMKDLDKNLVAAADGAQGAADAFAAMGLTVEQFAGLKPDERLALVADAAAKIEHPARRAAGVMALMGDAGMQLVPMLSGGADGIRKLRREANDLGLTVSGGAAQSASDLGDSWGRLTSVLKNATFSIGGALAPALIEVINTVTGVASAFGKWVKANPGVIQTIMATIAVVGGVGAALVTLGVTVSVVGTAIGGLSAIIAGVGTAVGVLGGILSFVLTPFGAVTAAVVAGGAAWLAFSEDGQAAVGEFAGVWGDAAGSMTEAWAGVVEAIQAGDLQGALTVVGEAMTFAWQAVCTSIAGMWNATIDSIAKAITDNPWLMPLIGAVAGGLAGFAAGGPMGALIGAAGGAAAGAVVTALAKDIGGAVKVDLEASRAALTLASERLSRTVGEVRAARITAGPDMSTKDYFAPARRQLDLAGARGTFSAGRASLSLGLSDQAKKQVDLLGEVKDEIKGLRGDVAKVARVD